MSLDFVAIDFETANQKRASVIQVGVAKYKGGVMVKSSSRFITPPSQYGRFDQRCIDVHGITPDMIVGALEWPAILERLKIYTNGGQLPLVAHNASVERSCITQASEATKVVAPDFKYFCTLKMARKAFPAEPTHSLNKLTVSLGLPDFDHHDAGADAQASGDMLMHIARTAGATTFDQLAHGWMAPPKGR
ncbi:exonuclease domain-containing protein [Leifsonia sp. Leaf264]|uniref:exonuclease domain-containing protein n=1 Tax=Leifsonia sp. Leaf264 TaxID=1736314 RepID=UPI0006FD0AA4|nr:exonuclease domain-containing protein [Leifsonia sp. Leaf264]KQO98220.1 hypothetical protein ASF30_09165 [Leifsonia sp. Leaf264]